MSIPISPTRLERPLEGRKVAGVCAAIARNQRVDPLVVRAAAVILTLLGGVGVIAYFAGLMLIPAEGSPEPLVRDGINGPERTKVILIGGAAVIALLSLSDGPLHLFGAPGTIVVAALAVIAVAAIVARDTPPVAVAPRDSSAASSDHVTTQVDETAPSEQPTAVYASTGEAAPGGWGRSVAILGGALLLFAVAGGAVAAFGHDVRWDAIACAGVIATGVLLVAFAPLGGARILIPVGLGLAVIAGGLAAADINLRGGVGDRLEHPRALSSTTTTHYHQAAGRLVVDLRDAQLAAGVTKVDAELGFGQLLVRVPPGVRTEVYGHASAGDVEIFGRDSNGIDARRSEIVRGTGPVLRVDAHAGFGQVRVVGATATLPQVPR